MYPSAKGLGHPLMEGQHAWASHLDLAFSLKQRGWLSGEAFESYFHVVFDRVRTQKVGARLFNIAFPTWSDASDYLASNEYQELRDHAARGAPELGQYVEFLLARQPHRRRAASYFPFHCLSSLRSFAAQKIGSR